MIIILSSSVCEGFECPLNVILFIICIFMVLLCVGIYPGSCLFGKGKQKKICLCFPLSFCGSIWELYYYEKKNSDTSSVKAGKKDDEEEIDMNNEISYNLRDRKHVNLNEDLFF